MTAPAPGTRSRPSALVVLGVYAGVVASLAIVPVSVPLLYRVVLAETRAAEAQLYQRTAHAAQRLERGNAPERAVFARATIPGRPPLELVSSGVRLPDDLEARTCQRAAGIASVAANDGATYTSVCVESSQGRLFAIYPSPPTSYAWVALLAVALAAVAGLVTALGVQRMLRPLSRIGVALDRLGSHGRSQRMARVGIFEIDQLIDKLNQVTAAVEDRENSILSRVQVVQEMARLVAHEVRNPLQSMELLTSLVADEDDRTERIRLTQSLHAEIRALNSVVSRLLREGAASGSLRLQLQAIDVDELIEHVGRLKQADARHRGVQLEVVAGAAGTAPLDRSLLSRSLENLVNNALRAVPSDGGRVRVSTSGHDDHVRLTVEDNGPGIDPSLGESIFDANVSGAGGTGLGLSLTRGVIEAHGGSIHTDASPLGGARFQLTLPRAARRAPVNGDGFHDTPNSMGGP